MNQQQSSTPMPDRDAGGGRKKMRTGEKIRMLVSVALFSALAYACHFVFHFNVGFLSFEAQDAVMTVGALYLGPTAGLFMAAVVSVLELPLSGTGLWGLLMDFLSSASFALGASLIYRYRRTLRGAIVGLAASIVGMTGIMMLANILITPIYMGAPRGQVIALIPTLLLPFNFTKATLNAALVLLLYKPVTVALARSGLIRRSTASLRFGRKEIILTSVSLAIAVACVLVYLFALGGKFELVG